MSKKLKPIILTPDQIAYIIHGTVKNLIDLHTNVDGDGYRFLFIMDCMSPEDCIAVDEEPETDEEILDIVASHMLLELNDFFDVIMSIKHEDEKVYRAFSTVPITLENMSDFIDALGELDAYWEEINQSVTDDETAKELTKGKNVVSGNGTVN